MLEILQVIQRLRLGESQRQISRSQHLGRTTVASVHDVSIAQGINAKTIRRALHQRHGYNGSVHALYRFLNSEVPDASKATSKLEFPVAEMVQVDFGMGPVIVDRKTGKVMKTWIFVMTLAWSRHQHAERSGWDWRGTYGASRSGCEAYDLPDI